jgi:predicted metal-dependent hydrolase
MLAFTLSVHAGRAIPALDSSPLIIRALTRRRPVIPEALDLDLMDGRRVRVNIRKAQRARRYTLRLLASSDEAVLTLPESGRWAEALAFLERHRGWLSDRLERRPERVPFTHGSIIPLRGLPHLICHRPDLRGTVWISAIGDIPQLCVAGASEHVSRRVCDFLKREARRDLEPAVGFHATRLGVKSTAIRLKDTKSRWGSCTSNGIISFSWRIVMAPPFVLDYLVAHEVSHLREMNHSIHFWRTVKETCPDMALGRAWLKANGSTLHAYGA